MNAVPANNSAPIGVLMTVCMALVATPVRGMTTRVSPRAMCKTEKAAWAVMDRNITRLSPTRATDLLIAVLWVVRPVPRLVFPGQRPNTTTANLVRNWENTPPARAAPYVSMRSAPVCGMPPVVPRIARIIVTSAADSFIIPPPIAIGGAGGGMANCSKYHPHPELKLRPLPSRER